MHKYNQLIKVAFDFAGFDHQTFDYGHHKSHSWIA